MGKLGDLAKLARERLAAQQGQRQGRSPGFSGGDAGDSYARDNDGDNYDGDNNDGGNGGDDGGGGGD